MIHGGPRRILRLSRHTTISLLILALAILASGIAQAAAPPQGDSRAFLRSIVGDWIGTCKQSTDGEQAEDKYFHATVKQVDQNTFDCKFEYYRLQNGSPLLIGSSVVTTTIAADGSARNRITGKGTVLVENKPKNQSHDFTEVVRPAGVGKLEGAGSGKISVSGLPLGVGKNGRVKSSRSTWVLSDGVLTIDQSIRANFRVLFLSKSFDVVARYTAHRGTDVAALMNRSMQAASRPDNPPPSL